MDTKLREALYILSGHNGIFRQIWELGRIKFTDSVPRAGLSFDKEGNQLNFLFNRKFYDKITCEQLSFVIAHECLHAILYHGKRFVNDPRYNKMNHDIFNMAADIAIHEVMDEFGFDIDNVGMDLCTIKTVFQERAKNVTRYRTTEYYLEQIINDPNTVNIEFDSHNFSEDLNNALDDIVNKAYKRLTDVEKGELKNKLKGEIKDISKDTDAGKNGGGHWYNIETNPCKKQKWEMVFKEFAQTFIQADKFDWRKKDRRTSSFDAGMFMPSHLELDVKKVEVWVFMDTSGSCIELASRFFSAAASLPRKFFDVKLFCFDTEVYPTSLSSKAVLGGGGTCFQVVEKYVRENGKPRFVFMITDGYGNEIKPQNPKSWHIFLTGDNKQCFPNECQFHDFNRFE